MPARPLSRGEANALGALVSRGALCAQTAIGCHQAPANARCLRALESLNLAGAFTVGRAVVERRVKFFATAEGLAHWRSLRVEA